jgi:hypothetical protein
LFGENYVFDIKNNMDKFEVYLKIPLLWKWIALRLTTKYLPWKR